PAAPSSAATLRRATSSPPTHRRLHSFPTRRSSDLLHLRWVLFTTNRDYDSIAFLRGTTHATGDRLLNLGLFLIQHAVTKRLIDRNRGLWRTSLDIKLHGIISFVRITVLILTGHLRGISTAHL